MRNTFYVFVLIVCPYLIPSFCFAQPGDQAARLSESNRLTQQEILDTVHWVGITSNWNDAQNWSWKTFPENGLPVYNVDVVIQPVASGIYPVITAGQIATCNSITIYNGGPQIVINAGANFNCFGDFSNSGTLTNYGKINLMGVLNQGFPGPGNITVMNVLQVSKTAGAVIVNKNFFIDSALLPTSGVLALGNFDITLKSTPGRTSYVGIVGSATGFTYNNGRFIVQRYISRSRKWQLLSIPTNGSQTIHDAWQDGGSSTSTATGYGVQITGPVVANGIDGYTASASMKYQAGTSFDFTAVSNTYNPILNSKGYFLYVYGNRSYGGGNTTGGPTTLQTRGKLFVGNGVPADHPPAVTAIANIAAGEDHMSVGNPFAAPVNFTSIYNLPANSSGNFKSNFKVWDPSQAGLYESGLYQTITGPTGWLATPGGGSIYNAAINYSDIQSGQAFYVEANTSGAVTLKFNESVKSANIRLVNRGGAMEENIDPSQISMISAFLFETSNHKLLDGNRIVFNDQYSDLINADDAGKAWNPGANFCILKNNQSVAVEARSKLKEADTIQYELYGLYEGNYQLKLAMQLVDEPGLQALLVDRYTNLQTPVSLSDSSQINFTVNSDAGSMAADRFYLLIKRLPQSLQFDYCSVHKNINGAARIDWKVSHYEDNSYFELLKSLNGQDFFIMGDRIITNGSEYSKIDVTPGAADIYYRIKASASNGNVVYSEIKKLPAFVSPPQILVAPNPVTGSVIQMRLENFPGGDYIIQLWNVGGSLGYKKALVITSANSINSIRLQNQLSPGTYQIRVADKKGNNIAETQVIIL